jgi:hypothetical protein
MSNLTRITAAAAAAALTLLTLAPSAGAITRPYLDLPDSQLPDVTAFDVSDTGHISVNLTVPADVPAGGVWTFYRTNFAAGGFDTQGGGQVVHEDVKPGRQMRLELDPTPDQTGPCFQIDFTLTHPVLNESGQPYAARLTPNEVCQPGYKPPTNDTPPPKPGPTEAPPAPPATPEAPEAPEAPAAPEAPEAPATPVTDTPAAETGQPVVVESARAEALPLTGSSNAVPFTLTALVLMVLGTLACVPRWVKRHALR